MIDLSKIKAPELPCTEIEVDIFGQKQTLHIQAYDDGMSLDFADIRDAFPSNAEFRCRKRILCGCVFSEEKGKKVFMSEADAELLIQRDGQAAGKIIGHIFKLRDEFDKERAKTRGQAEKN